MVKVSSAAWASQKKCRQVILTQVKKIAAKA
jgi:hypothetical protein